MPSVMPMPIGRGKPPLLIPMPAPPGPLPDSGGVNDQCAWLLDVFDLMEAEDARLMKARR